MYNQNNFYVDSHAEFKPCDTPDREPDYISIGDGGKVSSRYWYGSDENGDYVIRQSDHWGVVRNCFWIPPIDLNDLNQSIRFKKHRVYQSLVAYIGGKRAFLTGKAYFSEMKQND